MKMTRRSLAGIIAAPIMLSESGQAQAPAAAPPEPNAARTDFQTAARQISALKLPRSVEPATRFEA
jgi:hypothetical protein